MLVVYCCVTNCPKPQWVKAANICGSGIQKYLSWLVLAQLPSGQQQGLLSSEDLTEAGRSAFRVAHSHGHWQETSCALPYGPLLRLLEFSHSMGAGCPQSEWLKRESVRQKLQCFLWLMLWSCKPSLRLWSVPVDKSLKTSPCLRASSYTLPLEERSIKEFVDKLLKPS